MASAQLSATPRDVSGKGSARSLRAAGKIPAVIYGHGREPQSLAIEARELEKLLSRISAESTVIELSLDGKSALEMAAAQAPDIVVLDIGLPDMDGYELARRLRGLAATSKAVLIAATGFGQQQDRAAREDAQEITAIDPRFVHRSTLARSNPAPPPGDRFPIPRPRPRPCARPSGRSHSPTPCWWPRPARPHIPAATGCHTG